MRILKRPEIQVPLTFIFVSIIWVIFSDRLFQIIPKNLLSHDLIQIETIKDLLFALAASALIYVMIKSLNKQVIQSQNEYKQLFYSIPDPLLIYNEATKKIFEVNKAAVDTYGYSLEEFLEMTLNNIRLSKNDITPAGKESANNVIKHRRKNNEIIICDETTQT